MKLVLVSFVPPTRVERGLLKYESLIMLDLNICAVNENALGDSVTRSCN